MADGVLNPILGTVFIRAPSHDLGPEVIGDVQMGNCLSLTAVPNSAFYSLASFMPP